MMKKALTASLILLPVFSIFGAIILLGGCSKNADAISNTTDPTDDQTTDENVIELKVLSDAMEPALMMGHTYLFAKNDGTMTFEKGDVVLVDVYVEDYDSLVRYAHRIVRIEQSNGEPPLYILKGDVNPVEDTQRFTAEELLGKLIGEKK